MTFERGNLLAHLICEWGQLRPEYNKPAPREVVAWGCVDDLGDFYQCHNEASARSFGNERGYPVVKLTGFLP